MNENINIKSIRLELLTIPTQSSIGTIRIFSKDEAAFNRARDLFEDPAHKDGHYGSKTKNSMIIYANDYTIEKLSQISNKLGDTQFCYDLQEIRDCIIAEKKFSNSTPEKIGANTNSFYNATVPPKNPNNFGQSIGAVPKISWRAGGVG